MWSCCIAGTDCGTVDFKSVVWIAAAEDVGGVPLPVASPTDDIVCFELGSHTIRFAAERNNGNVLEYSVSLLVVDIEPPRYALPLFASIRMWGASSSV